MKKFAIRLVILAAVLLVIITAGVIGFMVLESLSLFDALYFTIITVATVGYGDISPQTLGGKILTIVIIITGVSAFTAFIVNIGTLLWERRERNGRIERMNVLAGLFLSEIGSRMLALCSEADPDIHLISNKMLVETGWTEKEFRQLYTQIKQHKFTIDILRIKLIQVKELLQDQTDLLVSLLENPTLVEHELFTELLKASFHLREELVARIDLSKCSQNDLTHIDGDLKRVYEMLVILWYHYIYYLNRRYPYLFSFAIRTNPFNENRCAEFK